MLLTLCGSVAFTAGDAGGERARLPAKCLALLAYLALEPGAHARDALGTLLWGDTLEARASGSLRQALTRLREVVGDELHADRTSVTLGPGCPTDVGTFLRLADAGSEQALDIDLPRFLEGLSVRDAPGFEEWAERTRAALLHRWRVALVGAARAAQARRQWDRAAALGERWQALDPLADEAAHFCVEVRFLMGDRDAALATYRRFRETRRRETGHEPGLALRELAERVESAAPGPAPVRSSGANMRSLPALDAELVGRAPEWALMERAWRVTARGHSRVLLIEGEVGIGRSRLLGDFLRFAATRGGTVLRARAFAAGLDVSHGVLLDLLRAAIDAPGVAGTDAVWLAELARVVPEVRQRFPAVQEASPLSSPGSLLPEAIVQLLLAAADEAPVVIALDDLQWCDGDSCHLLHHLVRRLDRAPILWCATIALGTIARDVPAAQFARALAMLPVTTRVRLAPLSRDEVWQLLRTMGHLRHPDAGARFATRVHGVTGGNPLYVIELLRSLFAREWLTEHPTTGEWMATDAGDDVLQSGEMFPSVREGIAERIAALPDEEHALLLTIAVVGRGCHASVLSYVHGISRLHAAHVADALVERHLVTEDDATYHCVNALTASVVLDSVGTARRREVHRMIALALTDAAASVRRTVDLEAVARHAQAGGELALAHQHALLASAASTARAAWDDALDWLDIAASCAETPEEAQADAAAAAALLVRSGRPAPTTPRSPHRALVAPWLVRGDLDLSDARPGAV